MVAARVADTDCVVTYDALVDNDDGSCTVTPTTMTLKASIHALQPVDIQRLREGGIEVQNGVSILLAEALEERPEKIVADGRSWRILTWTFVSAYDNESGMPIGTVVAVCDEIRVAAVE
jgi:hypothetical protein